MSENASATYRGFRNQALYVLYRLLVDKDSTERVYRPEGAEDLAVFDSGMNLIEVVQVKDYSSDLALSHFKPKSAEGFFSRLQERRKVFPECTTKIASFGPLGPELRGAIEGDAEQRANLVKKLCSRNVKITSTEAIAMLDGLHGQIVRPVATELRVSVNEALRGTSVAGALEHSIELLMYWVFNASENRRDLTRKGLIIQLERIGNYLAALRDSSSEWGASIFPLRTMMLSGNDAARWVDEYRKGVQAQWEHILAGADCLRPHRLQEIHQEVQRYPAVIIRGASGQGKSTLGWRYLHDYCPDGLRFHVKLVEGREHAMRIANALGAHVKQLNLQAIAYVDVSPADAGWPELVRELVAAGLKVLVAIREEDFSRANIAVGDFHYSEIILNHVTREEAESIYTSMCSALTTESIDFEDAWARFAMDEGGPLLEFVHFVSEGESLASRIRAQITTIQRHAVAKAEGLTDSHLELLALAAVANETGARVSLGRLYQATNLTSLTGPLRVLENEYLLRVEDEGDEPLVAGLHALRSKAIVEAFIGKNAKDWEKYAIRVLPLIVDEDIETFLLAAFSRRSESSAVLIEQLQEISPRSWTHAAGIVRSLIWEGINRYELRNRKSILAAMRKYGGAWWMVCDAFIGMKAEIHLKLLDSMKAAFKADIETFVLTEKREIFKFVTTWVEAASPPLPPQRSSDWVSAGDVAHWVGHIGAGGQMHHTLTQLLPSPLPQNLTLGELGRFVSGRARLDDDAFSVWHDQERTAIGQRFLHETDSIHVADDATDVKVYFSVPLADSVTEGMSDADDWHEQTMRRLRLLRLLFPHRESFSAQGLGLELFQDQLPHDPTAKNIAADSFPLERNVQLNANFANLVDYRHSRASTWREYTDAVVVFREAVSDCFRKLHRGWVKLLSESPPRPNTIKRMPGEEIGRIEKLGDLPMFPRTAVDEWGFLSEGRQDNGKADKTMQARSLRRFDRWRKIFGDFNSGVGMVNSKIVIMTALYAAEEHKGYEASEEDEKTGHLMLVNLGAAWEALRPMQHEFQIRFGNLVPESKLDQLGANERSNFRHVWSVAFAMQYERRRHLPNIDRAIEAEVDKRKTNFLHAITAEIGKVLGDVGTVSVRENSEDFGKVPSLCVVCDYHALHAVEETAPKVVEAVWSAAQAGGLRDLEWKPLEVEWPTIGFVTLFCGKALAPQCGSVSTVSFFAPSNSFNAKFYHYAALPVRPKDFKSAGFRVWESPLLRAAVALQGNVLAFIPTYFRFFHLANLIFEHRLGQSDTDRILERFSIELRTVLTLAQRSYADMIQILDTTDAQHRDRWRDDLLRCCHLLLLEVNEEAAVSTDLESLNSWMDNFEAAAEDFKEVVFEITEFAIGALGKGSGRVPRVSRTQVVGITQPRECTE